MSAEADEGNVKLGALFKQQFDKSRPGGGWGSDPNVTQQRMKLERAAGRTPKERARGGTGPKRDVQVNTRQTKITKTLLEKLSVKLTSTEGKKVSEADVIELAIAFFAEQHKVKG
ncbi:MAG: hypothetical protein AB7S74_19105 [Hyphomicrobium sp.]